MKRLNLKQTYLSLCLLLVAAIGYAQVSIEGIVVDNNLKKLGNYNPDFVLGWSNNFSWKNWSASILIDWRQGGILVSRTQALAGVAGQLKETENRPEEGIVIDGVVNMGTEENPVYEANQQAIPAESYYRQYYDRNHEENNTYDASYLKIRSVSIGYTFESKDNNGWFSDGRSLGVFLIDGIVTLPKKSLITPKNG